jgi:hypothetical protein
MQLIPPSSQAAARRIQQPQAEVHTASAPEAPQPDPLRFTGSADALPSLAAADALKAALAPQIHLPAGTLKFGASAEVERRTSTAASDEEARIGDAPPQAALQARRLSSALNSRGNLGEVSRPLRQLQVDNRLLKKEFERFSKEMERFLKDLPEPMAAPIRAQLRQLHSVKDVYEHQPQLERAFREALVQLGDAETDGQSGVGHQTKAVGRSMRRHAANLATNPWTIMTLLSGFATVAKTAAWYSQSLFGPGAFGGPTTPKAVEVARRTEFSHGLALPEYLGVISSARVAEKHGIDQLKVRGAMIEPMDLATFIAFEKLIKKDPVGAQHLGGLFSSAFGSALMSMPDKWNDAIGRTLKKPFSLLARRGSPQAQGQVVRQLKPREIAQKADAMQELIKRLDGPLKQKVQNVQTGLQEVLNGNIEVDLDQVPPTVHPSRRLLAAGGSVEAMRPALASAQALADTAGELAQAMRDSQGGMGQLLGGTTHFSRNMLKYLYFGIASVIHVGALVGAIKTDDPKVKVALMSELAAGIKALAWAVHTVIPDDKLLSARISPERARLRSVTHVMEKIALSWGLIAGVEYQALARLVNIAGENQISLSQVRSGIALADLAHTGAFMGMVKGEQFGPREAMALIFAGLGVVFVNLLGNSKR